MNYSVLMTFAVIAIGMTYYYIWGKEEYKGPLVERDVGTDVVAKGSRQDSAGTMQKKPQYGWKINWANRV